MTKWVSIRIRNGDSIVVVHVDLLTRSILKLALPNLVLIADRDLLDVEIDYFIHNENLNEALKKANELVKADGNSYYARKRRATANLRIGSLPEVIAEVKTLFLENPNDPEVQEILEDYFIDKGRLDAWKQLVQKVLKKNSSELELFHYLRNIGKNEDWLSICELDYTKFMSDVERLNLVRSDIKDFTYEKLPVYALETFISQIAIHSSLLNPAELWTLIYNKRQKKNQVPPFQLEDLEAAYPVWIFALHIYFLFKSHSDYSVSFSPRTFQNNNTAVLIKNAYTNIQIDISYLLGKNFKKHSPVIQSDNGMRWHWQFDNPLPEVMLHEVNFYSGNQFKDILQELEDAIAELSNG